MEVHHHAHSARQKWTHYFWEFLMLFLAVFCGFLAEYYLEHTIEHNREKQFINSLVRDIEADTVQLSNIKGFRFDRLRKIDSVTRLLSKKPAGSVDVHRLRLFQDLRGHVSFYQNSGTLDQLKNAGGLRLIRNRRVVDSIQGYDQQIRRMFLRDNFETEEMRYTLRLAYKLIDGVLLTNLSIDTAYLTNQSLKRGVSKAVNMNSQYLGEYLNSLASFRFVVINNMSLQGMITKKAENLLTLIKAEYDLK
ncbi:MAG TPA: hypothetical protein VFP97_07875 [Chitinophagaceae bacterium]|nr:hypothetical protein [Chitinophagaceae bacterium]